MAPNHYHPLKGKTEGTRSTPLYSNNKLPSLIYFITTTEVFNEKSCN
jgi:hypothetical protein